MSMPPALRFQAPRGPAAMLRLLTIIMALMLVVLGALAANHAQAAQAETSQSIGAEPDTAHQLTTADGGAALQGDDTHIALGLATGCIVLIACCAFGLATLSASAWSAHLLRRLGGITQSR